MNTVVIGMMNTLPYSKMFECCRRVYGVNGVSPACNCNGGGHREIKILLEL